MSKAKTPPAPPLAWYAQINNILSIQQAEIFALYGDTLGYPVAPLENLPAFLERQVMLSAALRTARLQDDPELVTRYQGENPEAIREVVLRQIWATLAPATGLRLHPLHQEAFDQVAPPPEASPFAAAGGGGIVADFARLHEYFTNAAKKGSQAPALGLVIQDADLLFDGETPLAEPEKTLLSYLRQWASQPLTTATLGPHRIFLVGGAGIGGFRPALLQGRITPIRIPLPTAEQRARFISVIDEREREEDGEGNEGPGLQMESDLDIPGLARITGALNLVQVEDVVYQGLLNKDRLITRQMVQERKDDLVRQAYGGVIEIRYPVAGFESLVGYEPLKDYLQNYVYPKLKGGDPRCPKGLLLSGPPGTGKTMLASALAAELKLPLVVVLGERLKSKYVGESNKNVARLCEGIVALAPAIVLIDEIDKMLPTTDDNTGVSQEMLGQLQMFMAEIPRGTAFFVATTNYPRRVPRAMLRPGRLEQVLPLLPAHLDGLRGETLQVLATRMGMPMAKKVDYNAIGALANDFTGADLEQLLIESDREATEAKSKEIQMEHLQKAIQWVVPTARNTKEMIEEALEFCSNRRFVPQALAPQVGVPAGPERPGKRRVTREEV